MNEHNMEHHEDHHGHHEGHHDHHHHGDFKTLFIQSLPLGLVIMILSPMMGITLPFQFTFKYSDILVAVLSTILLFIGGKPFYQGAKDEFKDKSPGMMALVSLGISVSYAYSIYAVLSHYILDIKVMDFFFEFSSLVLIMLLGHWIEMKAVGEAGDAQRALAELLPKEAHLVLENGDIISKPVSELSVGDIVRVQAGENIPADGKIIEGESFINESLLTGEFKPVKRLVEDEVIGGSTNGDGILFVEVTETGDQSFISQVQTLIAQAQSQTSRSETLAHKVASWLFYIALSVSIVAFIIWFIVVDLETAVLIMITTLVIACPHALGLAIPLVVARSTSLGASRGLLVKNREALELTTKSDVMILDKTGTLTIGDFKVLHVEVLDPSIDEDTLISLLYGIEAGSSHPIAQSINRYAESLNIEPTPFDEIEIISGEGVKGIHHNQTYKLISEKAYGQPLEINRPTGATLSILTQDDKAVGVIALGDEIKDSSKALMKHLNEIGINPIMATGDNEEAAKLVAEALNIDYYANQSPDDKYELVKKLKKDNQTVIMVGDGVNDAPALALSDVGIAIGAGTQVALDSADVILTQSNPGDISSFIKLSKNTNRKMKENLLWGAGYNFLAIPLAAGILAPFGFVLSPSIGAILMSLSTVIVAINAMLLKLD